MVADYQDDRASTARNVTGTITIGTTTVTTNKTSETAWGFSNFENTNNGLKTIFGNSTEKTSFKAVADIKCYELSSTKSKQCELGVSSDLYPTVKAQSKCTISINGTTLELIPNKGRNDGYDDIISIAGSAQKNVMFFTNYDAGNTEFFNLIQNSIGKTLDFNISWE